MSNFREVNFSVLPLTSPRPLRTSAFISAESKALNLTQDFDDRPLPTAEERSHAGGSSVIGASCNFINSIVGAGIIGIPFAVQECGFLLGMCLLIFVAFLIDRGAIMIVDCGMKVQKYDFEELAESLLGSNGYYAVLVSMFLFAYGGQTAYMVIIGDTVPKVAELLLHNSVVINRDVVLVIISVCIILPTCLLRDMSSLTWTSLLSVLADVVMIVIIFAATQEPHHSIELSQDHFSASDIFHFNSSLFIGIGAMSFSFVCQHNSFIIFRSLKVQTLENWKKVAHISILFALLLSISLGLIGILAFYPNLHGDLLNNFPSSSVSINIARTLLAVTMIFTYPMELFVSRHCLLSIYYRWKQKVNKTALAIDEETRNQMLSSCKEISNTTNNITENPCETTVINFNCRVLSSCDEDQQAFNPIRKRNDPTLKNLESDNATVQHEITIKNDSTSTTLSSSSDVSSSSVGSIVMRGVRSADGTTVNVSIDGDFHVENAIELGEYKCTSSDSFESIDFSDQQCFNTLHTTPIHTHSQPVSLNVDREKGYHSGGDRASQNSHSEEDSSVFSILRRVISPVQFHTPTQRKKASPPQYNDTMKGSRDMSSFIRRSSSNSYRNLPTAVIDADNAKEAYECHNPFTENGMQEDSTHHLSERDYVESPCNRNILDTTTNTEIMDTSVLNTSVISSPYFNGGNVTMQSSHCEHVFVSVGLWGSTLIIAVFARDLGLVAALTGTIAASMLGFVLPALIFFATYSEDFNDAVRMTLAMYYSNTDEYEDTNRASNDGVVVERSAVGVILGNVFKIFQLFMPFYVPLLMIMFGFLSLVVGLVSIFIEYTR